MYNEVGGVILKNLSWYISLAITFAGFTIISRFFTLEIGDSVGNINPAFIPIVLLIPFLLLSLFITFTVGSTYFTNASPGKLIAGILVALLIFVLAGGTEYQFISGEIEQFGGIWSAENSKIYGLGFLNGFTNDWYFNESVFLILHTIAFLVGSMKKQKIEAE